MRAVTMQALRDQYAPEGHFVSAGETFMATEGEALDFRNNAPHVAKRISAPYVPPGDQAEASSDPAAAWVATGIMMTPAEYLARFKGAGDHADAARAALGITAPAIETEGEPVKGGKAAKAKGAEPAGE